jgi:hypothetical protein
LESLAAVPAGQKSFNFDFLPDIGSSSQSSELPDIAVSAFNVQLWHPAWHSSWCSSRSFGYDDTFQLNYLWKYVFLSEVCTGEGFASLRH